MTTIETAICNHEKKLEAPSRSLNNTWAKYGRRMKKKKKKRKKKEQEGENEKYQG